MKVVKSVSIISDLIITAAWTTVSIIGEKIVTIDFFIYCFLSFHVAVTLSLFFLPILILPIIM